MMEYNTIRPKLIIPEYGRTVQKIADYISTLPAKEERNKAANTLINIMGQVNPQPRDQVDIKHKFWDHLYVLSDFKLDVDCPFEKPLPTSVLFARPKPIPYSNNKIRFRHYGKNVERMLDYALSMEEGDAKQAFVNSIASYMKMSYWMWNNDKVPDLVVIENIREMTGGKIVVTEISELSNDVYIQKTRNDYKSKNFKNKNNNNNNRPSQGNKNKNFQNRGRNNNNNNNPGKK